MQKLESILELPEGERNQAALDFLRISPSESPIFLFGERFSTHTDAVRLLEQILSVCRMTYRTGFEPIEGYTNDIGWGCMMRTGQMALANVLVRLECGAPDDGVSRWSVRGTQEEAKAKSYRQVLRLFGDCSSSPLSIQNIVLSGGTEMDIKVGHWFGPNAICQVLSKLVDERMPKLLRVYVAQDGAISEPELLACSDNWTYPVLVFIPLRLGLESIQHSLAQQAASTLKWPQSVGILGGKPRSSYFFVGLQDDHLLYVDPHYPQGTVNMEDHEFSFQTYHSHVIYSMKVTDLDPSLALALLCTSHDDYLSLKRLAEEEFSEREQLFNFSSDEAVLGDVDQVIDMPEDVEADELDGKEDWSIL